MLSFVPFSTAGALVGVAAVAWLVAAAVGLAAPLAFVAAAVGEGAAAGADVGVALPPPQAASNALNAGAERPSAAARRSN